MSSSPARWAEVDLGAIGHNLELVKAGLPPATRVFAVVKANGYGHGARQVAAAALQAGAYGVAVSTLDEAEELAAIAGGGRLLVLGGLPPGEAARAHKLGAAVTCSSFELARALAAAGSADRRLPIHLKVDTGMARFGCAPAEAPALARFIAGSDGLELAGTYTHFAASESNEGLTRRQFQTFTAVLAGLGVDPGIRHAANSAAALRYPDLALDGVRVGIALYGCEWPQLRPALSLRTTVAHLKTLPPGATVGYGATWTANREVRLATATIGYADGVHRARSNRGWALVRGARAPLVGRVSMDAITLDVTDIPGVEVGDRATLLGVDGEEAVTAEAVAGWSETISYEVLTSIGPRVARLYSEYAPAGAGSMA